jgi:hypothetical protein
MRKNQMDAQEKLNFFRARRKQKDTKRIAENTNYSVSHVINVIAGRRNVPEIIADEMYRISSRRKSSFRLV